MAQCQPSHQHFGCWQLSTRESYEAQLNPVDGNGQYLIELRGVSIKSRYPENRMCKALLLAGVTGNLEIYGPSTDGSRTVLRLTVDIEKHGHRQLSETGDGVRYLTWTDKSLVPVQKAAEKLKRLFADPPNAPDRSHNSLEADAAVPEKTFRKAAA